jgi:hypothetical protein
MRHDHHDDPNRGASAAPRYARPSTFLILVLVVAAAYLIWTGHRQHVASFLPYALLLLCPLIHSFGHHGHGGRRHGPRVGEHRHDDL